MQNVKCKIGGDRAFVCDIPFPRDISDFYCNFFKIVL